MNPIRTTFDYGAHSVTLETGVLARQASGAVLVTMHDTTVLVAVVGAKNPRENCDFLPLTVNYQERTYAAGRIPGGFLKREGRPSEKETLTSRLIDRPLRPLFPEGFHHEVQVIATVLSVNPDVHPDIPAMLGASAALAISGIPFQGPLGGCRVGYVDNQYVLNPTAKVLKDSQLDLVVAGTKNAVLMVESEAKELSEAVMLGAVTFGHKALQVAIDAISTFAKEANKPAWSWQPAQSDQALVDSIHSKISDAVGQAYQIVDKQQRRDKLNEIRTQLVAELCKEELTDAADKKSVENIFGDIESKIVRGRVIAGQPRIDGRDHDMIRGIHVQTGVLPRTHGSAVFTRGETQALVVATLGTERDSQIIDGLTGEYRDPFMLHYNFPPYCVGEVGMVGAPKRREIGHGNLARRAVTGVLPKTEDFPYVIRVVSEITESNGSSSMATVCGTSLALMDAGIPIKDAVAGIAMGLIKEGDRYVVLSDIMGDEDHLGDMDFKVAGTAKGITALQMDIKIDGINEEIMGVALKQAKAGRLHILSVMNDAIQAPRTDISEYAPRITTIKIDPDKIRDVIGKGGVMIRSITEETGAVIEIEDDGTIKIAAVDQSITQEAIRRIEAITADVEVDKIYTGKVVRITDFGAFVNLLPGKDGLVHISQIAPERVENVRDYLTEGQEVTVKVVEIDRQGRVRLTMKSI